LAPNRPILTKVFKVLRKEERAECREGHEEKQSPPTDAIAIVSIQSL
jgi:hypothetical protein